MSIPQKLPNGENKSAGDIIETVIAKGDLSKLTPDERVRYYNETCRSLGLNPLTRPFEYITLNGQLRLYGRREAADQLRKIHGISIRIISQEAADGLLTVHVHARTKDGREDEDIGVVNFPDQLKGELRANTMMKAITKAKRRVTMSISGLGFLDETEVEDIPRENPHVTRPQDIVDVPPPNHPDRIPNGASDIKPLPVKDQRPLYQKLVDEMHAIKTVSELKAWAQTVPDRVAGMSDRWKDFLQSHFVGYIAELRAAEGKPPPEEADWFTELDAAYAKCNTIADVFDVDRKLYDLIKPTLTLEDQLRASVIREEHLTRIENENNSQ